MSPEIELPAPGSVVTHVRWGRGVIRDDRGGCLKDQVLVAFDQSGLRRMYVQNLDVAPGDLPYSFTPLNAEAMASAQLVPGERYEVIHQAKGQRYARRSVLDFQGRVAEHTTWTVSPGAAPREIPDAEVRRITEVPASTPPCLDERATYAPARGRA